MTRVQELIRILADKEVIARGAIARAHRSCKICNQPADQFRTQRAELEYSISSICQTCQDYYLPTEQ